jgi:hypothetical protein
MREELRVKNCSTLSAYGAFWRALREGCILLRKQSDIKNCILILNALFFNTSGDIELRLRERSDNTNLHNHLEIENTFHPELNSCVFFTLINSWRIYIRAVAIASILLNSQKISVTIRKRTIEDAKNCLHARIRIFISVFDHFQVDLKFCAIYAHFIYGLERH